MITSIIIEKIGKATLLSVPGIPPILIPNKPVKKPKGKKMLPTIERIYIVLFI
jgi:hypothetical protein